MQRTFTSFCVSLPLLLSLGACQLADPGEPEPSADAGGCFLDVDCPSTGSYCQKAVCNAGVCSVQPVAAGTPAPNESGAALQCQRLVCDGKGAPELVADVTAVPTDPAPTCNRYLCDAPGHASLSPDPSNLPADPPHDCQAVRCSAAGTSSSSVDVTDVPEDQAGDCMRDTCTTDGAAAKIVDDTDEPAAETCFSHGCNQGSATSTPINPTATCSDAGYVCGADGSCSTCPAPDAACTDPGPGSREVTSAHDYQGIGRTDTGGRYACGAVPVGEREYYTYFDNGTGVFSELDPYFELRPVSAAKLCAYFDCPSLVCPAGTTTDTLSAQPGCCWDAPAGTFTGRSIDFCSGARVTLAVSSSAACASYELHFHD